MVLQVHFNLRRKDYFLQSIKKSGNCCASDLESETLQEVVSLVETVNRMPVEYIHSTRPTASRSRGEAQAGTVFVPDEPKVFLYVGRFTHWQKNSTTNFACCGAS